MEANATRKDLVELFHGGAVAVLDARHKAAPVSDVFHLMGIAYDFRAPGVIALGRTRFFSGGAHGLYLAIVALRKHCLIPLSADRKLPNTLDRSANYRIEAFATEPV